MIEGMFVSGFMVRALRHVESEPLAYGLFQSAESAQSWADKMTIPAVVEPVYTPVYNRG